MSKKKTTPTSQSSLQDQLAQLKKQLKAQPTQAQPMVAQPPKSKATAQPTPEVKRQIAQAPVPITTPKVEEKKISDAETVEFFRAAGDAAPIADNGRIRTQTKAKAATKPVEALLAKATKEDEADFAAWVQRADTTAAQVEKKEQESREAPRQRAIEKQRVWLQDLDVEGALERLRRFLRAAKERGEARVTVVYGASRELRYAVETWLGQGADGLVQRCEEALQPNAVAAVLSS